MEVSGDDMSSTESQVLCSELNDDISELQKVPSVECTTNGNDISDEQPEKDNEITITQELISPEGSHKFLLPSLPLKTKKNIISSVSKISPKLEQITAETEARETPISEETANKTKQDVKTLSVPYKEPSWSAVPPKGYNFEILKGGVVVETLPFDKPFLVFGRLPQCDVMLEHPSISRFHCIVQYRGIASEAAGAGIYVYDLSSTHGTYQNKNRLQPKVYNRLKVGHMIKLGGSSRNFLLMGPNEDAEEELPFSVAELREMARKKEEEKRLKAEQERKQKEDEAEQKLKAEAERGIDWGMGPDAEEVEGEEDADAPNPYSDMVREELYLDDPKKSLRGWYEREGYDLPEYDVTEITSGRFKCTVKLPVLSTSAEPLLATVDHRGKKKDTVVQAALEACRLLDKHGLFRQATHVSRAVKVAVESDSDEEDEFLDRTGDVERKRGLRYVRSAKREKVYTYEELRVQHATAHTELRDLAERLLEAQRAKEALVSEGKEKETEDLDIFMRSMNKLALDKHKVLTCKLKFIEWRKEEARLRRLLNVARPADVAEVPPPTFPRELVLPGSQRPVDKKLTASGASSNAVPSSHKGVSSGVHAAFLEEDEAPKLKLSKLDANEDYVPKSIPYDRSVYSSAPKPRPRSTRPPAKYVLFDDSAERSNSNNSNVQLPTCESRLQHSSGVHEAASDNHSRQDTNSCTLEANDTGTMRRSPSPECSSACITSASQDGEDCSVNTVTETPDAMPSVESISPQEASEEVLSGAKRAKVDANSDVPPSVTKKRKTMGADQQASLRAAVERASSGGARGASKKKTPQFFDFDDPRAEEDWVPPQDQTGDGRTALNDKLGY